MWSSGPERARPEEIASLRLDQRSRMSRALRRRLTPYGAKAADAHRPSIEHSGQLVPLRAIVSRSGPELTLGSALHSSDRSAARILVSPEPVLRYPLMADRAHVRRPIGSRPEGQDTCGGRESQPGDNPYGSHVRSPRPTREA